MNYEDDPNYQAYAAEREMWDDISNQASRTTAERPSFEVPEGTCVYRRNGAGRWVVMGPAELVIEGEDCVVTTKAGKGKLETILGVGEPFERDGRTWVYGYIAQRARSYRSQPARYRTQEDAAKAYNRQWGAA